MDAKVVAVLALVLAALCISDGECAIRARARERLAALRRGSFGSAVPLPALESGEKELVRRRSLQANLGQPTLQGALPRVSYPASHGSHRGFVLCQARTQDLERAAGEDW